MPEQETEHKIELSLTDDIAQGVYSNLAIITHSNSEFIIDFASIMPGRPKAAVNSRVIMTPQNAKRLLKALSENISNFEQQNGIIDDNTQGAFPPLINDGGIA